MGSSSGSAVEESFGPGGRRTQRWSMPKFSLRQHESIERQRPMLKLAMNVARVALLQPERQLRRRLGPQDRRYSLRQPEMPENLLGDVW